MLYKVDGYVYIWGIYMYMNETSIDLVYVCGYWREKWVNL